MKQYEKQMQKFDEHWRKAREGLGRLDKCEDVNGWIRDSRDFAEKVYEEGRKLLDKGIELTMSDKTQWDAADLELWLVKVQTRLIAMSEENHRIAIANNIVLENPLVRPVDDIKLKDRDNSQQERLWQEMLEIERERVRQLTQEAQQHRQFQAQTRLPQIQPPASTQPPASPQVKPSAPPTKRIFYTGG